MSQPLLKGPTYELARAASELAFEDLPADVRRIAKQCLLDWIGVSLAARHEPLVAMLATVAADEGGHPQAILLGRGTRATASQAVLINGAMGHALDYDDVIIPMGHPTVPVAPVAFALAEQHGATGADLLCAFVAGVETEVRAAHFMGPTHYARGFHSTGTLGTLGAAAAAGRLLGLDPLRMATAFGIAATQAAGLKSMFGTMSKPLHAGKAASNGLLAATLAARGFTGNAAVLETPQGFGATHSDAADPAAVAAVAPLGFWIRETLFKYHAACYLTHSALNAAAEIARQQTFALDAVEAVEIHVDPGHLGVCAIQNPVTGLECKFSLSMTVAMMLAGENTADEALYTDATAHRPDLVDLRNRVSVIPRRAASSTLSGVTVRLGNGQTLSAEHDVATPARDLSRQGAMLEEKFEALSRGALGDRVVAVIETVGSLDHPGGLQALLDLIA